MVTQCYMYTASVGSRSREEVLEWEWMKMMTKRLRPDRLDLLEGLEDVEGLCVFDDDEIEQKFGVNLGSILISRLRRTNRRQKRKHVTAYHAAMNYVTL